MLNLLSYSTYDSYDSSGIFSDINTFSAGALIFLFIFLFFLLLICAVIYIFGSIGFNKMMKNLKLNNSWMAFIPILNYFALGKIAEQYVGKNGKKSPKFSVILLVSGISLSVLSSISSVFSVMIETISATMPKEYLIFALIYLLFSLFFLAVSIAVTVIQYMAYWRIYSIFANSQAVLFLILSIFIPFVNPFLIFAIRNNEPKCIENLNNIENSEG